MEPQFLKNSKRFPFSLKRGIMPCEMFPLQSMDSFLKLKLELVYKDLPIEVAEQRFNALKQPIAPKEEEAAQAPPPPKEKKVRKLKPKKEVK